MMIYKNNELVEEIDSLISLLDNDELGKVSMIMTGSLSRGNPRIQDGKLKSDIDILVIVNNLEQVYVIREYLLKNRFDFKNQISLIFCLRERITVNRYRGIIASIRSIDNLLLDNLNIKRQLGEALNLPLDIIEQNLSLIQEFCYYSSKYLLSDEQYLKIRISNYWRDIINLNNIDKKVHYLNFEMIYTILKEFKIPILNSSKYFFNNVEKDEDLYVNVRELVSLENQGLRFEDCILNLR